MEIFINSYAQSYHAGIFSQNAIECECARICAVDKPRITRDSLPSLPALVADAPAAATLPVLAPSSSLALLDPVLRASEGQEEGQEFGNPRKENHRAHGW